MPRKEPPQQLLTVSDDDMTGRLSQLTTKPDGFFAAGFHSAFKSVSPMTELRLSNASTLDTSSMKSQIGKLAIWVEGRRAQDLELDGAILNQHISAIAQTVLELYAQQPDARVLTLAIHSLRREVAAAVLAGDKERFTSELAAMMRKPVSAAYPLVEEYRYAHPAGAASAADAQGLCNKICAGLFAVVTSSIRQQQELKVA
jgi:hypothetical protein